MVCGFLCVCACVCFWVCVSVCVLSPVCVLGSPMQFFIIMKPLSYPWKHSHSKSPAVLTHVPCPHRSGEIRHSSISTRGRRGKKGGEGGGNTAVSTHMFPFIVNIQNPKLAVLSFNLTMEFLISFTTSVIQFSRLRGLVPGNMKLPDSD